MAELRGASGEAAPSTLAREWERMQLLPFEKNLQSGEWRLAVPQAVMDILSALMLPGDTLKGEVGGLTFDPQSGSVSSFNDPELISRAAGFPAEIGMPGLIKAALGGEAPDPAILNIFAGQNARTADEAALWRAKAMESYSTHPMSNPNNIFAQTGWFRGADGQWRFEIPDNLQTTSSMPGANAIMGALAKMTGSPEGYEGPVSSFIKHPALFEAYPDLANILTKVESAERQSGSHLAPYRDSPELISARGATPLDIASVLLHELQHAVQVREGFGRGGSPEFTGQTLAQLAPAAQDQLSLPHPHQIYSALMGEVEARNVQDRFELGTALGTPFEVPPWVTQSLSNQLQIDPSELYDAGVKGGKYRDLMLQQLLNLNAALSGGGDVYFGKASK